MYIVLYVEQHVRFCVHVTMSNLLYNSLTLQTLPLRREKGLVTWGSLVQPMTHAGFVCSSGIAALARSYYSLTVGAALPAIHI